MSVAWRFSWFRGNSAAWFARLKGGRITPRLDAKYRSWLAANPANEIEYERHELAWELAGELSEDGEIAAMIVDAERADVQRVFRANSARQYGRRRMLTWSAAAATLTALAIGTGLYLQQQIDDETYTTAIGEQRTVVLPDQSRMVLNTSTQVRVVFRRDARVIELEQGEATFSVTHDASRPFEVVAARGTTRAIGTEFNVMSASEVVTVSVLSGTVEVIAPGRAASATTAGPTRLTHGHELTYSQTHISPVQTANAARIQAWHSGRIAFEDVPLQQALTEFNRYTRVPVVVRDASLSGLRVTGLFRIGESKALVSAMETAFDLRADYGVERIELRRRQTKVELEGVP